MAQGAIDDPSERAASVPGGPIEPVDVLAPTHPQGHGSSEVDAHAATVHRSDAVGGIDVLAATGTSGTRGSASVAAEFPVQSWERYEILSLIGRGGMGSVFKARDRRLARVVALKFLRVDDAGLVARFQREASTQARLEHPNICRVFEVGEVERKPYIAMQFVDGKTLDQAAPYLALFEKVVIIKQVALALHEAHRLGIIHRDVKPSNIMVVRKEDGSHQPLVMDFGIAHEARENRGLTETGAVMGTPAYMSPEQARGGSCGVDRRADVYSLGATLYELLTGKAPFGGAEVVDVLLAVLNEEPASPRTLSSDVPKDLETIVLKCLAKDAGQRYDSARALAEDLQCHIDGEPIRGKRASLRFRLLKHYRKHRALYALVVFALVVITTLAGVGIRERVRLQRQAELAQRLGQEIKDLEWMLRSARQLPIHNLGREKVIVRKRMSQLQTELRSYGDLAKGLGHYALGRGHMALHEYKEALAQLELAIDAGNRRPEVYYALGFVLGKHYEQAIYEARIAGGGDFAKNRLKEIEPKYLTPAINALSQCRERSPESAAFLDGLIAFYRGDYDAAIEFANAALRDAPWLYEAHKLVGDVHLQRALRAYDRKQLDESIREFSLATKYYDAAIEIGPSDTALYEGLAEIGIRLGYTLSDSGRTTETSYRQAMAASQKLLITDPDSIVAPLKKAFAAVTALSALPSGESPAKYHQQCLTDATAVLQREPGNPYASDLAANCLALSANDDRSHGKDPSQRLRRAISMMEPVLQTYPHFLWGLQDIGLSYRDLGLWLHAHGSSEAKAALKSSLSYFQKTADVDKRYAPAYGWTLDVHSKLVLLTESLTEQRALLSQADGAYEQCVKLIGEHITCDGNRLVLYARAAWRAQLAGDDPRPLLKKTDESIAVLRKLKIDYSETEQSIVLARLVDAVYKVRKSEDAESALAAVDDAIAQCLRVTAQDPLCLSYSAQAEWAKADFAAQHKLPTMAHLQAALAKATLATQSPETDPNAWQVLAESHLRLAKEANEPQRSYHLMAGHTALAKVFGIKPNHAAGRATEGVLLLLVAESSQGAKRKELAQSAQSALENSATLDPLLATRLAPLLKRAGELFAPM